MKKSAKLILIVLALVTGLYLFMIAPRMSGKTDMAAFTGVKFAHRGYFDNENGIPENSIPSFEKAIENGYGIELDVQLSADGVPMVFHDADLERMTGVKGKIWEYTAEELDKMTLLDTSYTICTLEYVMNIIDGQVPVIVEHKMDRVDTAVCEKSYEILAGYSGDWCMKSFDPRAVMWYKQNAPHVIRGQLAQEYWKEEKYAGKPLYVVLGNLLSNVITRPDFISYKYSDSDNISLNICRLMGAHTACWTLRSEQDYSQVNGKFDMYIFDSFDINAAE
ncbi:MAG: glycerophosphodiester phosphodiesterase [Oscillospiraceae bacterium]|nr:glycerophosphodiester phosphodiesterase [Oscillospiraceae bacterium]